MVKWLDKANAKGRLSHKLSHPCLRLGRTLGPMTLSVKPSTVTAMLGVLICTTPTMEPCGSVSVIVLLDHQRLDGRQLHFKHGEMTGPRSHR